MWRQRWRYWLVVGSHRIAAQGSSKSQAIAISQGWEPSRAEIRATRRDSRFRHHVSEAIRRAVAGEREGIHGPCGSGRGAQCEGGPHLALPANPKSCDSHPGVCTVQEIGGGSHSPPPQGVPRRRGLGEHREEDSGWAG